MDTKMISSPPTMKYTVVKLRDLDLITRGRHSVLSDLLEKLLKMNKDDSIIIETTPEQQSLVARRMRSNIFKWKLRKGLHHVGVHKTKDGRVALYYDAK